MPTIGEFKKQRRNANRHTERGLKLLSESVDRDGWIGALTVAADGETFDGSARLVTAQQDNQLEPIIVDSDGSRPVIVRRTDIATADDPKAKRLGVMANHVTATDWEPDAAVLAEIAKDDAVIAALAKEDARLAELLRDEAKQEPKDAGELVDKAAELQAKWQVERGDVWQVGKHRVMCGDSTNAADVARLMQGERAQAGIHDPPYGIGVDKAMHEKGGQQYGKAAAPKNHYADTDWDSKPLSKDVTDWLFSFTPQTIIWGGNYFELPPARCFLVWDKQNEGNQFADCELAWTNLDKPVRLIRHLWNGMLREGKEERLSHPTQKPLGVIVWAIQQFDQTPEIIFDGFLGSGTTLVACEQTGRIGRGMEIEPKYVSVTLERLSNLGLAPVRL